MEIQLLKPERENLSISFELSPFITDWASARTAFMASVAREFGEVLNVRPHDFYTNDPTELGESRCTYRIFGGASTIVLNPATLDLNFSSLTVSDYPTAMEIVGQSVDILSRDIGCYAKDNLTVTFNRHVSTVENGGADRYLAQFAWKQPADTAAASTGIEYSPAAKIVFADKQGRWSLHRTVEKSVLLPDGLFVTTIVFVRSLQLTSFDEQQQLLYRIHELADQAMGHTYLGEQ